MCDASVRPDSRQCVCGSHKSPDRTFVFKRQTSLEMEWSVAFFTFQISQCNTRNFNFVHALRNSTAFPVSIFTKITSIQQYYVKISYTEFYPDRSTNVGSKDGNWFTPCNNIVPPLFRFSRNKIVSTLCRFSRNKIMPTLPVFTK